MFSDKTIYKYIDLGILNVRNIDLPRKVRFRNRTKATTVYKIDKKCLENRTYEDFLNYIKEHPDTPIVEMDGDGNINTNCDENDKLTVGR